MGMVEEDNEIREEIERPLDWNLRWCGVNADVITAAAEIRRVANFIVCGSVELQISFTR